MELVLLGGVQEDQALATGEGNVQAAGGQGLDENGIIRESIDDQIFVGVSPQRMDAIDQIVLLGCLDQK